MVARNITINDAYGLSNSPLLGAAAWPGNSGSITIDIAPGSDGGVRIDVSGQWPDTANANLVISLRNPSGELSFDPVGVVGLLRGSVTNAKLFSKFVASVRNGTRAVSQTLRPHPSSGKFLAAIAASQRDLKGESHVLRPVIELRFVRGGNLEPFTLRIDNYKISTNYDPSDLLENYTGPASPLDCLQKDRRASALQHYKHWYERIGSSLPLAGTQQLINPFIIEIKNGRGIDFPMFCCTGNSLQWYGRKQHQGLDFFIRDKLVTLGDVALDCGAHAGLYSTFFAKVVGPEGKVFAFDPFPQNNIQIETNAMLNGFDNVHVEWAGVGAKKSELAVSNRAQKLTGQSAADMTIVRTVPLDNYVKYRPTFLKLDVEGYEVEALKGAQRLLHECTPSCYIEVHPQFLPLFGHSSRDLFDLIPLERYEAFVYGPDIKPGISYKLDPTMIMTDPGRVLLTPKTARSSSTLVS